MAYDDLNMVRRRTLGVLAIFTALAVAGPLLAGCGKKGDPKPPSGGDAPYPRTYPEGATPDPDRTEPEL